jgi:AcrR family transcriptional regulator
MIAGMAMADHDSPARPSLSRERILVAAIEVADRNGGIENLTMRGLAEALGVEAMSLYYHLANKDAVLDGMAEQVVAEINEEVSDIPSLVGREGWKAALRHRILTARSVMLRHKWAPALLETRTTMNPAVLQYFHGLLEIFRSGGMSYDLAHHALHALGSRALGFTQEMFDPAPGSDDEEMGQQMFEQMATDLPLLVEMLSEISHDDPATTIGWCDDQAEFEFGLDLLLDGLDNALQSSDK